MTKLIAAVVRKFKNEGIAGVWRATAKRVVPFLRGMIAKRSNGGAYHILYVNGCTVGESQRYRINNLIESLGPYGVTAQTAFVQELPFLHPQNYALVIFFRCDLNQFTEPFAKKCKELHVPTVFDVDDLIFDESIVEEIDAYNRMSSQDQELYVRGVRRYRKMMEICAYATASTEYLRRYMEHLTHKPVYLIRNGINKEQLAVAQTCSSQRKTGQKIGFLSGSVTHQKDFSVVSGALTNILKQNPHVTLTVIGYQEIPDELKLYQSRIEMIPFMDYRELLKVCADFYLVVVPLEHETKFCQAKSELKYFEQALLGVPVIASPTPAYCEAIRDGENGFLAGDQAQWEEKIGRILHSPELREKLGKNAATHVRNYYYPDVIGQQAKRAYDEIIHRELQRQTDFQHLKVSFVIPEPLEGAGGHRNIFRVVRAFSQRGHDVTVYIDSPTGRFLKDSTMKRFVTKEFFDTGAEFRLGCDDIASCDILIATHWHTAYVVQQFRHRCVLPCYFIQDFEPYFYSMGEEYVQAYATYSFGFTHIASGKWAAQMVEKVSGRECPYFVFPLQREIYHEDDTVTRQAKTVLFFAKPQMPRRAYMLGVEALHLLKQQLPEARILFYGADICHYGDYGFEYEKVGLLRGPVELAKLYRGASVGLCFSLTNPSLVPYEMMACGLPVVDLNFNGSAASYDGYGTACLVQPSPQAICDGILRLLHDPDEAAGRVEKARHLTSQMPTESEMETFVVDTLLRVLSNM